MKKSFIAVNLSLLLLTICVFAGPAAAQNKRPRAKQNIQRVTIVINNGVYSPANLRLKQGVPARLTMLRKSADECGEVIVFPAYGIRRRLPLNRPVVISFTPRKRGSFTFTCGMDMMYGKLIVN
jgi:plastocyanin domain-containing protein